MRDLQGSLVVTWCECTTYVLINTVYSLGGIMEVPKTQLTSSLQFGSFLLCMTNPKHFPDTKIYFSDCLMPSWFDNQSGCELNVFTVQHW